MITKSLFLCWKNVLIIMNIWMIGKNSTKHHYLKHEKFYSHVNIEEKTNADYTHAERVCKNFEIKI